MGSAIVRKSQGQKPVAGVASHQVVISLNGNRDGPISEDQASEVSSTPEMRDGDNTMIKFSAKLHFSGSRNGSPVPTTPKRRHSFSGPGDKFNLGLDEERAAAAFKLRQVLKQLDKGEHLNMEELHQTLTFAADVLSENTDRYSAEEKLSDVRDSQVRAWLAATFTRTESRYEMKSSPLHPKDRFRAVANTIMISKFMGSMHKEPVDFIDPTYPHEVTQIFQDQLDKWNFNIFGVEALSSNDVLRFVGYELFKRHNLFKRCEIPPACWDMFLTKIEAGYGNHSNPYHNATHGADVAQTVHHFIYATGLVHYLTPLEILSLLLAAIIHDVDHPGTSNSFQIMQQSEYAMLYNDRAVLENHHLYYAFMLLKEDDCNFLKNLKPENFHLVRTLVIDMVLATDMSFHFEQLKKMRLVLSAQDAGAQLLKAERSKLFCLLIHMADISHPGKPWQQHSEWTRRLCEEFFQQGDEERKLGRSCSPLCDRENTNIPEGQLGFMDFIVSPSYEVCGTMLELCLSQPLPSDDGSHEPSKTSHDTSRLRVWEKHLVENRDMWKSQCSDQTDTKKDTTDTSDSADTSRVCNGTHEDMDNGDHCDTTRHNGDTSDTNRDRTSQKERVQHNKHSLVETHTISTVETVHTPSGSEMKTIKKRTIETVTTDEATLIKTS